MANQFTFVDHSGEQYYDLTLIEYKGKGKYLVECLCGNQKTVSLSDIKLGRVKSCGHRRQQQKLKQQQDIKNIIGKKLFNLTILEEVGRNLRGDMIVSCLCECGNQITAIAKEVKRGKKKSCGCRLIKSIKTANTTHGESNTRLYEIWHGMKQRCLNPKHSAYKSYGGRGIKICDEWIDYETFRDWSLINGYRDEEELSIERINVDGNYESSNCEWIPLKKQAENKRNTLYATINGRTERLIIWCRELGLRYDSVYTRIKRYGYSPEKALTYNVEKIKIN